MDGKQKKQLSEIDICDLFITPAIKEAGWDMGARLEKGDWIAGFLSRQRGGSLVYAMKVDEILHCAANWATGAPVTL